MKKMDEAEVRTLVEKLPGWTVKEGKLHREYQFADFPARVRHDGDSGPGD